MKAWHFVGDTLRDGQPIPADGEWLEHGGDVEICKSGLHYSKNILDALYYAPGSTICMVEVDGIVREHEDKGVARRRRILWRVDGKKLLRDFARRCALDVIHLWDAPPVVVEYLKTGDGNLRLAARAAAWAAEAAARDAVRAASDVARDVARAKQNRQLTSMVMIEHKRIAKGD